MFKNPTEAVDISFNNYLNQRKRDLSSHIINGIPDYSFAMDYALRQKINSVPGMYQLFQAITTYIVPLKRQELNMNDVAVGPHQYPEIYAMGEECARRLGIGIPKIFVKYDVYINACTYATEDAEPVIEINSALIERLTPAEIKTIIGHECGHIHNNHTIYSIAAAMVAGTLTVGLGIIPGLQQILRLISLGAQWLLAAWSRAGEITSDRAGLICSNGIEEANMALAKIGFGGGSALENINLEEYIQQIEMLQSTPVRYLEMNKDHPLIPKRILANRIFNQCDVLYSWRPDWRKADMEVISKQEADKKCESFIAVSSNKTHI